jgi:glycosyltransferase involved in cell wall biosynthesis
MSRPTLTVAVIAQNEAARLAGLLPRLRFADEVLVVDGGSTDETVAIARTAGATVVERKFDTFAAQRNAVVPAARGDWIFYIDADERPTPALVAELRQTVAHTACCGFRVPIRSTIFGRRFRFSGTQDDAPLRLVRRDAGRWVGAVHETFSARGGVGRLAFHLEHETLPTVRSFLTKMQRYTQLAARDRAERGIAPRLGDRWWRPPREVFRRLVWKQGWLDGPAGWTFCLLSGLSEWLLASEHRRLWRAAHRRPDATPLEPRAALAGGAT